VLNLPKFKAAAVQAAPVFLDTDATVDKVCALIGEAAGNGARLVAFPEVFVAGYPYWNWIMNPIEGSPWFERLCRSAIEIPGAEIRKMAQAAARHRINVVVGVNERNRRGVGTLYNTLVTIADDGRILGRHRKLVPTWAEKLTWAPGDASALRVHDTSIGPLGSLACGENTNTLARFALLSQGELVHVASYIALPVAPADYDMAEAIRLRAAAHSFEGKVSQIRLNASMTQNVVTYTVEINTDNVDGKLLPYLTANVQFEMEKRSDVLTVPNGALRWTPLPELSGPRARSTSRETTRSRPRGRTGRRLGDTGRSSRRAGRTRHRTTCSTRFTARPTTAPSPSR